MESATAKMIDPVWSLDNFRLLDHNATYVYNGYNYYLQHSNGSISGLQVTAYSKPFSFHHYRISGPGARSNLDLETVKGRDRSTCP